MSHWDSKWSPLEYSQKLCDLAYFLCSAHTSQHINIFLYLNHGWSLLVQVLLSSMTHFLSFYFCITCHSPNFVHFCAEDEDSVFLWNVNTTYQTAWCPDPEDHNMRVRNHSQYTSTPSEIMVNCVISMIRARNKHTSGTVMSCPNGCLNTADSMWLSHLHAIGKLLWK